MSLRTSLSELGAALPQRPLAAVVTPSALPRLERRPLTVQVPEARSFMVAEIEQEWHALAQIFGARLGDIHHEPARSNGVFLVSTAVAPREILALLVTATQQLERRLNDPRGLADVG